MSDFLSNLAVRSLTAPSLGSSGRVRPRLPYRFENPALPLDYSDRDEVIGEVHAPSDPPRPAITSRPPAPIDPRPTESPRRPAADFHQPPPLPTPGQTEVATAPDQPPRPRRTRPLAEPDAVQIVPRREPVEPVIRERIIRVVEEAGASLPALDPASSPSPVEPPPPRSVPSPREHTSQPVVPSIVPHPPEPPSVERRIERAPRVRVTIGRVEVQAAPPPSPPPKPTPQPPRPRYRPAMTLADYLDQRNGGKR